MSRPRRNTDKTVRLTAYVDPSTRQHLLAEAARQGVTIGALLDNLFKPQDTP